VRGVSFWWNAARLETFTVPRSLGVVCITNYTRDAVAGLAKKTWVVPNAVDESFFCRPAGNRPGLAAGHSMRRSHQLSEKPERLHPRTRPAGEAAKKSGWSSWESGGHTIHMFTILRPAAHASVV